MSQKVIRGWDSLEKTGGMMEKLEMRRPLIVGSAKLIPKLKRVKGLEEAPVFSGYHPNPDLADAEEGVRLFRD